MKTAVVSAIYPAAKEYLKDFAATLAHQTDREFELLLVNDGLEKADDFFSGLPFEVNIKEVSGTIAQNRQMLIRWALERGFEALVFADADDGMDTRRVQVCREILKSKPFAVNELEFFGCSVSLPNLWLAGRFEEGEQLSAGLLRKGNCLGLSNTAIRAESLKGHFESIPEDTIAVDWMLFASVLEAGIDAVFTGRIRSFYRQHENQTAGFNVSDEKTVERGLRVKLQQHRYFAGRGEWTDEEACEYETLLRRFSGEQDFRKRYCEAAYAACSEKLLWWEWIKTEKELCVS